MLKTNDEKKTLHVQCAFKADCEKLLTEYADLRDLSYAAFAKVWTDMSFSLIFSGKSSYEEQRLFTEVFFFTAKKFLIYTNDVYMKVGTLYLLYGLYYKQPLKGFVKIRMTKSEYALLLELIKEMKARRQMDALYIFTKMKCEDVFHHVYTQTHVAPDLSHFADTFSMKDDLFPTKPASEVEAQLKSIINNEDVIKIGEEYRKAVQEYASSSGETCLMTFNTNIVEELNSILETAIAETPVRVEKGKKDDIGSKRRSIKAKAAALHSKPRRTKRKE